MYAFLHFFVRRQCFKLTFSAKKASSVHPSPRNVYFAPNLHVFLICRVIRVLNPTLLVPQASQYHHISILYRLTTHNTRPIDLHVLRPILSGLPALFKWKNVIEPIYYFNHQSVLFQSKK